MWPTTMRWAVGVGGPRGPGAEKALPIALAVAFGCLRRTPGITTPPTVVWEFLNHSFALFLVAALEAVAPV